MVRQTPPPPDRRLVTLVVVTVTLSWFVSVIVGLWIHEYVALTITTPLMGGLVGYVTGMRIWRNGDSRA